jgi:hypothetical protein
MLGEVMGSESRPVAKSQKPDLHDVPAGYLSVPKFVTVPMAVSQTQTNASTQANFDALAISLAAQNNAIAAQSNFLTFATLGLGMVGIALAIGWGLLVKLWAQETAKTVVHDWMSTNAFNELSKLVKEIVPNTMDDGATLAPSGLRPMTQAEQEEQLGNEPTQNPS